MIERTFDAPIELVWRMGADGAEFASWYGPAGASVPVAELDVRVGGRRRVCMEVTTPAGPMRMWFGGEYRIVDAPPARTDPVGLRARPPMAATAVAACDRA